MRDFQLHNRGNSTKMLDRAVPVSVGKAMNY